MQTTKMADMLEKHEDNRRICRIEAHPDKRKANVFNEGERYPGLEKDEWVKRLRKADTDFRTIMYDETDDKLAIM